MRVAFVISMCAAMLTAAGISKSAEPGDDAAEIQGQWGAVAYLEDGEDVFGEAVEAEESPVRWEFSKDTITFLADVEESILTGNFKLNSTTDPRSIDLEFPAVDGAATPQTRHGIYELGDDTLVVCYGPEGAKRPDKLESKAGSGLILIKLKKLAK